MARFQGIVQGSRGEASRLGGEKSGMSATARGWKIGGEVRMFVEKEKDCVRVTLTGGSGGAAERVQLGVFALNEQGQIVKIAD